jgi:hypothetical protein
MIAAFDSPSIHAAGLSVKSSPRKSRPLINRKVNAHMRVVTNQQRVNRNRQIAQILFFVSLAILFGGLIITNTLGNSSDFFLMLPCLVMPIGLVTTIISIRMTNQYVREPHPEDAILAGLKGINKRSVLFNYLLPANHVLISPQGVYTFTTRFQESRFKIEGGKWTSWKARGPLAPLFLFLKQEALGDPFKQANSEADAIEALIKVKLPNSDIPVQPVIVFTSPKAYLEVIDPDLPVVYADLKLKPSLKGLMKDDKKREDVSPLTAEQMNAIEDALIGTLPKEKRTTQLVENEV